MKSILRLITFIALPFLCGNFALAQDEPPTPPPPETKPAGDAAANPPEQVRMQLDVARQQLDRARAEGERARLEFKRAAQPPDGAPIGPGTSFSDRLQNIIKRVGANTGEPSKPLVIHSSSMDPKDQAGLEEDLQIMARILGKTLERIPGPMLGYQAMGIDVFSPGSPSMRNLYLDGYGAVFTLNVAFPLLPPPPPQAEPKKEESESDSAWEQAKNELYGPGAAGLPPPPAEEFSEERVDQLKSRLLEALKSASNIRQLKSSDSVTVCVLGGPGGRMRFGSRAVAKASAGGGALPPRAVWATTDLNAAQHGTIMTIRAKKSDIDAFAKGKLDRDQFSKSVKIEIYPAAGVGDGPAVLGGANGGFGAGGGQF